MLPDGVRREADKRRGLLGSKDGRKLFCAGRRVGDHKGEDYRRRFGPLLGWHVATMAYTTRAMQVFPVPSLPKDEKKR